MSSESVIYEVLYYKRTNKVHKSKGVSKSDGMLKIEPSQHKVSLFRTSSSNDGEAYKSKSIAIASCANKELSQRNLQEDETIVLGAFEVQIVSQMSATMSNAAKNLPSQSQTNSSAVKHVPLSLQKKSSALPSRPPLQRAPPRQPNSNSLPLKRPADLKTKPHQQQQPNKQRKSSPPPPTATPGGSQSLQMTSSLPLTRKRQTVIKGAGLKRPSSTALTFKHSAAPQTNPKTTTLSILPHIPLPASLAQVLRPHQVSGVEFLWTALQGPPTCDDQSSPTGATTNTGMGALLADEMGLGKTLMTIAIIAAMHRQERSKQFIVVCPSSLVGNWSNEFDKWIGKAGSPKRVVIKKGGEEGLAQIKAYCSKMKQQGNSQNGQVLIISYDLMRLKAVDQFQSMMQSFKLLVVDEGHRLKNTAGSLTLTALESIPCDARLCITATPCQNKLDEFYTLANFCRPGCFGDLPSFRRNFERPIAASTGPNTSRQQRQIGNAQSEELDKITRTFMLRRLQKDILKTMLPPRSEFLVFCRPSSDQEDLYQTITKETGTDGTNAEALTKLTALRKLCVHPMLCEGGGGEEASSLGRSGKLLVIDALLKSIRTLAPNDKIVLVSNYTSALSVVESLILKPRGYSYSRLDGTTNMQDRLPLVDSFNRASSDAQFCMLLSAKAGGVGLNLAKANRLIMLDCEWNPAIDIQSMGRVYRQGQTKPTFIYRFLTSGTIEEVIYQRQSAKGDLAGMAVDGKASSSKGFTKEELADCFTLKEDCRCDTKRILGNRWPAYSGADDLDTTDTVLLEVARSLNERIGHVHVVTEKESIDRVVESDFHDDQESLYDSDEEEEMEFD